MNFSINKKAYFFVFFAIIALLMQIIVFENILIDVYKWHLKQPETIEGFIQTILILLSFLVISRFVSKKYRLFLICLVTILYLMNTNLLLPVLAAVLYFEVIISIGIFITKKYYQKSLNDDSLIYYLRAFFVGFIIWGIIVLTFSGLGLGTINNVRVITILLFLFSLLNGFNKPFSLFLIKQIQMFSLREKGILSVLTVMILTLFVKSNRAIDYDSIWYGLRPEYVLVGENSFFDNLGLVQFIHFYPKLFELFTLPLSNLKDYSFIYSINITFFIMTMIIIYKLINLFLENRFVSLIGTLVLCSIPAIANISATAKPDIFSVFFIVFGVYQLLNFIYKQNNESLIFGFSSLIISLGGKSTSFLYVPIILIGFLLIMIYFRKQLSIFNTLVQIKSYLWILLVSIFVLLFTCYRTFKLTGYPVYPAGLGLWNKMGFKAKYPVTSEHSVDGLEVHTVFTEMSIRWYKLLFDPADFGHIIMLWVGNVTAFMFLVSVVFLIFKESRKLKREMVGLIIFMTPITLVGIFFGTFMRNGGDGNYFLIPIIFSFIALFVWLNVTSNKQQRRWLNICLAVFLPFQLSLTFVSHPSWKWGTQEFSSNLNVYTLENNATLMEVNGLVAIEDYLLNSKEITRTIGFGVAQTLNHLPTRFEHIEGIASDHLGNSKIIATEKDFLGYILWAKIDCIIIPQERADGYETVKNVIQILENDVQLIKIETPQYILYDLRGVDVQGMYDFFD
ncbi:hypothetical protein [Metasolibacillus meyeri]|uniref:hypothetical protein n=1 Tax=Metasolibacillus meyeri TaxID=1071052 RepID=UPI0012905069|nr:hypothetical protein [Metasolibacillus meyeri]